MSTKKKKKNRNKKFRRQKSYEISSWCFFSSSKKIVLAFNNTTVNVPNNPIDNTSNRVERNSFTKSFLPRVNITNYSVLIDGRNFYDQPINDQTKQYDEIRKAGTGQGDD